MLKRGSTAATTSAPCAGLLLKDQIDYGKLGGSRVFLVEICERSYHFTQILVKIQQHGAERISQAPHSMYRLHVLLWYRLPPRYIEPRELVQRERETEGAADDNGDTSHIVNFFKLGVLKLALVDEGCQQDQADQQDQLEQQID